MASGATDRLDVTAWTPATRTSWDSAGIAARTGTSAQDRFGAALDAARIRDDAAAAQARAASQRDATEAARARQTSQRADANAARAASDRDRDAAAQAEARAADRRSAAAQPTTRATGVTTGTSAQAAAPHPEEPRPPSEPAPAANAPAQPAASTAPRRDEAAPEIATSGTPTKDPAAAASTANAPTPAEPAAQANQTDTTAQAAHPDPAATLLSLIAAMSGGTAARAAGTKGSDTSEGPEIAGAGSLSGARPVGAGATVSTAAARPMPAGTGTANAARGAEGPGLSEPGVGAAQAEPAAPTASPVEAVQTGTGDAPAASGPGQDFLAALADAGQAAGPAAASGPAAAAPLGAGPANPGGTPATPTASAGTAGAVPAQTTATAQTTPPIPIGQVPMTIGLRSLNGSNAFQIRLDPVELGRVDVKLEIDKARGTVTTHLVVDRPETLALLQRDANQLQQALTQAGLDPSAGGLNLSLRGDGSAQTGGGNNPQGGSSQGGAAGWTRDQAEAPQEIAPTRWLRGYGGLDIKI